MEPLRPRPALSDDHIDLLTTSAIRWEVLVQRGGTDGPIAAAPVHHILGASPSEVGQTLRREHNAALTWRADRGIGLPAERVLAPDYTHRPVTQPLDPVEVIKATHAAQEMCGQSPAWKNSSARAFLDAVERAAQYRLPGYAQAPWKWARPEHRGGPPIGVALPDESHPDIVGIDWVTPIALPRWWSTASLIIVTTTTAYRIPTGLTRDSGVVLVAGPQETQEQIHCAVEALGMADMIYSLPHGRERLEADVRAILDALPAGVAGA